MGTRLEQFIRDHRDEFDTDEPGEQVWNKLQQQLQPPTPIPAQPGRRTQPAILIRVFKWSAAAAILILAGLGVYSLLIDRNHVPPAVVQQTNTTDTPAVPHDEMLKEINPGYAQEVYHFTQLIELKQNELKKIQKEHPNLYKKFVTDIDKLDSSYNALKRELPENPNREQLLEAMIENLRLQTEILNQQLNIIKQIKESNNDSHESNSKKT
jgi:hypothetical protein